MGISLKVQGSLYAFRGGSRRNPSTLCRCAIRSNLRNYGFRGRFDKTPGSIDVLHDLWRFFAIRGQQTLCRGRSLVCDRPHGSDNKLASFALQCFGCAIFTRALIRLESPLAYLLTDEAYAVTINHYQKQQEHSYGHLYFLGAGIALWISWQLSTAVGITLGKMLPPKWPLDFSSL